MRPKILNAAAAVALFISFQVMAQTFPYSTRTKAYTGYDSALKGDINTIGMGGATVALPSSISAAESNPAGYAMEVSTLTAQINKNTINDNTIQRSGSSYSASQWGLGVCPPPWGFGISYYSPKSETGTYVSPNTGHTIDSEVAVKELRVIVARSFLNSRLALGMALGFSKGIREIGGNSFGATGTSFQVGGLYRMPDHIVVGASVSPADTIRASGEPDQLELPGFNQPILKPTVYATGIGWIPNRFFKAGFSLHYIAATANTALLADQRLAIGNYATVEPRMGASYVFAEFNHLKMEFAAGSYFEPTRIEGGKNRIHATMGLEINPYFGNLGAGIDIAGNYKNVMISAGIDLVRTLRTFDIIPGDPVKPLNGYFPNFTEVNPDGLAPGLTTDDRTGVGPPSLGDVKQIIKDIPGKIEAKFNPELQKKNAKGKKKRKKSFKKPEPVIHDQGVSDNLNR